MPSRKTKKHFCDLCEYSASRKEYLLNHVKKNHPEPEPEHDEVEEDVITVCDVCDFKAEDEDELLEHMTNNHRAVDGDDDDDDEEEINADEGSNEHVDQSDDEENVHDDEEDGEENDVMIKEEEDDDDEIEEFNNDEGQNLAENEEDGDENVNEDDFGSENDGEIMVDENANDDEVELVDRNDDAEQDTANDERIALRCELCDYKTTLNRYLRGHYQRKHGVVGGNDCNFEVKSAFQCHLCPFETRDDKRTLEKHLLGKHGLMAFVCCKCGFRADTKEEVNRHKYDVHFKAPAVKRTVFQCDFCGFRTMGKANLEFHYLKIHKEKTVLCDQCAFRAENEEKLREHYDEEHHPGFADGNRVYACELCHMQTLDKRNLKRHYLTVHKEVTHICSKCNFRAETRQALNAHIGIFHNSIESKHYFYSQNKHDIEKTLKEVKCNRCEKTFTRKESLTKHVKNVHGIGDTRKTYQCEICEFVTKDQRTLKSHYICKHRTVLFVCPMCDFTCESQSELNRHKNERHEDEMRRKRTVKRYHKCRDCYQQSKCLMESDECNRSCFDNRLDEYLCVVCKNSEYQAKRMKMDPETLGKLNLKSFECRIKDCDFSTFHKVSLRSHYLKIHRIKKYPCEKCDDFFDEEDALREHMSSDHTEGIKCRSKPANSHYCTECDYSAKERRALIKHLAATHGIGGKSIKSLFYVCTECGHGINSKRAMEKHYKMKHGIIKYICTKCIDFVSESKESLFEHLREDHKPNQIIECKLCGFVTKMKDTMKSHHANRHEKPIHFCGCCGCLYFSSDMSDISEHMKDQHDIGHGEAQTEFKCDHCGKLFGDSLSLNRHKSIHNRIIECDECGYEAVNQATLKKHKMIMHTDLAQRAGKKVFKCTDCKFGSFERSVLVGHFQRIHDRIVKICLSCCIVCENDIRLKEHIAECHKPEVKKFPCDKFVEKSQISQVRKNHESNNNNEETEKKNDVDLPMKSCPKCNFKSVNKAKVEKHVLTYHGETLQSCNECDFSTGNEDEFRTHWALCHIDM